MVVAAWLLEVADVAGWLADLPGEATEALGDLGFNESTQLQPTGRRRAWASVRASRHLANARPASGVAACPARQGCLGQLVGGQGPGDASG
eukprot:4069825-Alexandrium_andersonii.AAC.1